MKTAKFHRCDIVTYYDLTTEEQAEYTEHENSLFVFCPFDQFPLPLDMFVRDNGKLWHGFFAQTYFSAYFVRLSSCGTQAVVAYKYS